MAGDMFLKIGDIQGESKDHKYKDWVQIESWSWGESQTGSAGKGGGAGIGAQEDSGPERTEPGTFASTAR